jgi:PHD/YefM family antitoxin component YafN of YafNO toxin-antitoxin module
MHFQARMHAMTTPNSNKEQTTILQRGMTLVVLATADSYEYEP